LCRTWCHDRDPTNGGPMAGERPEGDPNANTGAHGDVVARRQASGIRGGRGRLVGL
jgi:hypothetical protein